MNSFEKELRASLEGDVHFESITRQVYSVDASIFEVSPLGVVLPKTKQDLINLIEIATDFKIPLIMRGAATGITGGCLGQGLIVDLSKYLNHILKLDLDKRYVICEPGVIQDHLNQFLSPLGFRLGPDTSTGNRATIGGMLANNAAGSHSLRFGKMSDHVQEVELVLSGGETINFSHITEEEWIRKKSLPSKEGKIYQALWSIKQYDSEEIHKHFPNIPRRVSGYRLEELVKKDGINIACLLAGSEGTLGAISEIRLGIVPKLKKTGLLLLFFDELLDALRTVPQILAFHPIALEMIDAQIIRLGRSSPSMHKRLEWLKGNPEALLVCEVEGETDHEVKLKIDAIKAIEKKNKIINSLPLFKEEEIKSIWDLRKSGLTLLLSKRTYSRAIAFLEDLSIPPSNLASFMEQFLDYLKKIGKEAGIYGHAGSGCMHIRPYFNLSDPSELALMRKMMEDITPLVVENGGTLSGEHGDGYIRTWLNPTLFGEKIMKAFSKVKETFDPLNLMNPGKIVPNNDFNPFTHLRSQLNEELYAPKTFLNFEPEGGFALAADLCNGNGFCRKQESLMCPSFQATNDEFHSTRARAQALREIIHKKVSADDFTGESMHDVMDLCISCKGCKTQCPSQVDMAKFKSEFLFQYQEKNGYTFRNKLFANIGQLSRWGSPFASLLNVLSDSKILKKGLEWIGVSMNRPLPKLALQRFSTWFFSFNQPFGLKEKVLLLSDTFTEFYHPAIGIAAVKVLNRLGHQVLIPPWSCCGRPALSKGFLPKAKRQAHEFIQGLLKFCDRQIPIIGLEPSCLLTIRDDYLSLIDPSLQEKLNSILSLFMTLDEFLALHLEKRGMFPFQSAQRIVKVHGHCYQKAIVGMKPTIQVLQAVDGFEVKEIHSGCCGMAGSFGYEAEHEKISHAIGNLILFPEIKKCSKDEWIIASGTSCREQIDFGTQRKALHLAEALGRLSK